MKNTFLSLILLLLTFCTTIDTARAQKITPVAKTTEPVVTKNTSNEELTLALVVGVSKYRTIQPNLQFAHQDAIDFANFLVSKVGGSVPIQNIVLLKDTMATSSQIYRHLEDLKERALKTKAGKKVRTVLFFSMHGGAFIDPVGKAEKGYLLTYDTDRGFPTQSSIKFDTLHQYTQSLLKRENTKVEVYIDACRAGLDVEQNQEKLLAAELLRNWDNVLKIVSCSPREYSYESEQWKNGAFTYYLLRGLRGLADDEGDKDGAVSLYELTDFLTKHLKSDLGADNPQMPEKQGYGRLTLAKVDSVTLASIKANIELVDIKAFSNKSFVENGIKNMDKETQRIYKRFTKNLYIGSMDWAIKDYELLAKKITEEKDLPIRGSIKRELIAGLMDDRYQLLSGYINSVDKEKDLILTGHTIESMIHNIQFVIDLIGKKDIRHNRLLAEKIFLEGIFLRKDTILSVQKFRESIEKDSSCIFSYNELGGMQSELHKNNDALLIYNIALLKYSSWYYLWNNKGVVLNRLHLNEEALKCFDRAIILKSDNVLAYHNKGIVLRDLHLNEEALKYFNKAISIDSSFSESYYRKGTIYFVDSNFEKAFETYVKYLSLVPNNIEVIKSCALIAYALKQPLVSIKYWNQYLKLQPTDTDAWSAIAYLYLNEKDYNHAKESFEKSITLNPQQKNPYYNLACLYSLQNQSKEALSYLEQALQKGYNDFAHIKEDTDLDNIRALPEFSALLKKYQK